MNEEPQSTLIMKEMGDLKEKLATNTANTTLVLDLMKEVKLDLKTMSATFVTHEQHSVLIENDKDKEIRLRAIEKNVWKVIGALAVLEFAFPIILHLVLK